MNVKSLSILQNVIRNLPLDLRDCAHSGLKIQAIETNF